jgi:hypothetical protein
VLFWQKCIQSFKTEKQNKKQITQNLLDKELMMSSILHEVPFYLIDYALENQLLQLLSV